MQYRAMILSKQAAASAKQALKALSKPPKPLPSPEKTEAKARGYAAFLERKEFKKAVKRARAGGGSSSVRQSYVPLAPLKH
jgi:hypothetical protein